MNLSRWCRHALGAALAVMTLMGAARAQTSGEAGDTAEMVAMLTKFLASDEYRTGLTNHFRSAEPSALRPVCDELVPDFDPRQHRLTIVSPMAMDKGLGVPARGTWTSSVPVNRCGVVVRRTALAQALGGGQIRFAALLPGDTLTTVKLQTDTVKAAEAGVGAQFGCKDPVQVIDTAVDEKPVNGAWTEIWTFAGCGSTQPRAVRFTRSPSGQGVDFAIGDAPPTVKPKP